MTLRTGLVTLTWLLISWNALAVTPADSLTGDTIKKRSMQVFPVPAIGNSPETNWYFGAVSLFTFKHFFNTPLYSTAKAEFNYTLNKQIIVNASWFVYTHHNRHIIAGDNAYLYFPEYYYGFGSQTPDNFKLYVASRRLELYHTYLWQLTNKTYLGVAGRAQRIWDVEPESGKETISQSLTSNNAGWSIGLGPNVLIDHRSRLLNPEAGNFYLQTEYLQYRKQIPTGNNHWFSSLKTDIRLYRPLFKKHILALQLYSMNTFGDAPYRLCGMMGSDSHMRGYYQGRYRDAHYTTVQSEARIRILPWLGFTAFGALGEVYNFNYFTLAHVKYSIGGGLRIRVDKTEDTNLRVDVAHGKTGTGFYVAFGEAF